MTDTPLDDGSIERLIVAASAPDTFLRDVLNELGARQVADLLVDEITFRADVPKVDRSVQLGLDIAAGDDTLSYTFTVEDGVRIDVKEGRTEGAAQRLEYDLADLTRVIFGPSRDNHGAYRAMGPRYEVKNPKREEMLGLLQAEQASQKAMTALLSGIDARLPDLGELTTRYGSDKWGGFHWYTAHYEQHLAARRDDALKILEIGIGGYGTGPTGGGSLKAWRRYFTRGLVYGLDIMDKSHADQNRIKTLQGSQNDPDFLTRVAEEHGPFDIIVDDGSHLNEHIHTSFRTLFPYLRHGGCYIIEDMQTSYWPGYGGDAGKVAGPQTSIGLVKSLVDSIQYEEHPAEDGEPSYVEANTVGLHVYRNMAFIDKGFNKEGSLPGWLPRTPR